MFVNWIHRVRSALSSALFLTFAFSFFVLALWSMANPMFGSPDEGRHVVRSEAAMHWQWGADVTSRIPMNAGNCFLHKPEVTADCMDLTFDNAAVAAERIPASYPPLAPLVYGIPALFLSGVGELYAMRLFGAAFVAACIAVSTQLLLTRWRRTVVIPIVVLALTPQALLLGSSVNPGGIANGLSLLLASSLAVNVPRAGRLVPRWVGVSLVVCLGLFPWVRRDSAILGVLSIGLFAVMVGPNSVREFLRSRFLQVGLAVFVISSVLARVLFTEGFDTNLLTSTSEAYTSGSFTSIKQLWDYFRGAIGVFGALDTPLPLELITLGFVVIGALLLISLAGSQSWNRLGLAGGTLLLFVVPVAFSYQRYPYFQGRYLLPFEIVLVVLAGLAIVRSVKDERFVRSVLGLLASLMVVLQFFAFAHNLRRYSVGPQGSWFPGSEAAWQPPWLSVQVFDALFAVACVIVVAVIFWPQRLTSSDGGVDEEESEGLGNLNPMRFPEP